MDVTHEEDRSKEVDAERRGECSEKDSVRRVEQRSDLVERRVQIRVAEHGLNLRRRGSDPVD